MLNRSASLAMSTSVLKALPGKLDIKRHSPSILYLLIGWNGVNPLCDLNLHYQMCLLALVCDVLLSVCYFSLWYPGSGVVLDCIDS